MYVERMIGLGSSQAGANDIWCVCVASIGGEEDGGEMYGRHVDILI